MITWRCIITGPKNQHEISLLCHKKHKNEAPEKKLKSSGVQQRYLSVFWRNKSLVELILLQQKNETFFDEKELFEASRTSYWISLHLLDILTLFSVRDSVVYVVNNIFVGWEHFFFVEGSTFAKGPEIQQSGASLILWYR